MIITPVNLTRPLEKPSFGSAGTLPGGGGGRRRRRTPGQKFRQAVVSTFKPTTFRGVKNSFFATLLLATGAMTTKNGVQTYVAKSDLNASYNRVSAVSKREYDAVSAAVEKANEEYKQKEKEKFERDAARRKDRNRPPLTPDEEKAEWVALDEKKLAIKALERQKNSEAEKAVNVVSVPERAIQKEAKTRAEEATDRSYGWGIGTFASFAALCFSMTAPRRRREGEGANEAGPPAAK